MTKKEYGIIMDYFNEKKIERADLEKSLDFENLTMGKSTENDIEKLLSDNGYKKTEIKGVIRSFVYFIKSRSGSGEITWDDFAEKFNELCLEDSEFNIRVQRFSKEAYWEVFFNHYDIREFEDGKAKLTLDNEYYYDTENEDAWKTLEKYGINDEMKTEDILSLVANKWSELSQDEKDELMTAITTPIVTHYVDKSRVDISNDDIKSITMTNADLVPEMGLRDYTITFTNGEMIHLRF